MNKKNIGAALSIVAAVAAGATAYASTINNLESDRNTNSMIKPIYENNTVEYYTLVKSDYTEDLKNTAIANEVRTVQNTNETRQEVEKIEKAAKEIVNTTIIEVQKQTTEVEHSEEETTYEEIEEVVVYDNEALAELEDETTEEVADNEEVVTYAASNLDEILVDSNSEELEVKEAVVKEDEVVNYLDNNIEVVDNESNEVSPIERFVNAEALNIRSSKTMDSNENIVRTLVAGDKVNGVVEGDWLKTEEGYLSLNYLSEAYPQALIDSLKAKEEEKIALEAKKAEEARLAEEARKAEEKRLAEEAKALEAKKAAEAVEVAKAQETKEEVKGVAFTGWVYNTPSLNVRDKARDGKILGTLKNGTRVDGEIIDGWVKFNYNGTTAYVSSSYLSTTEIGSTPAPAEEVVVEAVVNATNVTAIEEVVDEEEVLVEAGAVVEEVAPVVNNNGLTAANAAIAQIGKPYVWGSENAAVGFDCSGLVRHAYKQVGITLPHSSAAQFNSGYAVDSNSVQAGDLVFFSMNGGGIDHVGIVTSSDGTFVHASTPTTGVKYDNIFNSHYQKTYRGARRIF